jgi:hypothetical protein
MARRIQIRRNTSADPLKLAFDEGHKKGLEEGAAQAKIDIVAAERRAVISEVARSKTLSTIASMEEEIRTLRENDFRIRREIETLRNEVDRMPQSPTSRKIRKRMQNNDTKDWIAQFGEGEAPYAEDEEETERDRAYRRLGR